MKALVLAGGRGKRLDDLSENRNKCMIAIGGKPVLEYNLDNAVEADVDGIILVVGYRAEEIINHIGNTYKGKPVSYVIQWEQRGLVSAMQYATEALNGDDFILMLGDEVLLNPRHTQMQKEFAQSDAFAFCGIVMVDDRDLIRRTYTFIQNENNEIYRLIEKPRNPLNDYMGTGNCIFKNGILDYIEIVPVHHERNEKELPDLIQCAIDDGKVVKSFLVCDKYTNINSKEDIEMATAILAKR
jgi:dTDP-glucose pyrophosphorylase